MPITVEEALKLNALKVAKVAAGDKGLNRLIHRVSVAECPEFESTSNNNWKKCIPFESEPGDFFITSFFSLKENKDEIIFQTIKLYNEHHSSGLLICDVCIDKLPQKAEAYANEHEYPVIFISFQVPYADIISEMTESIYLKREQNLFSQMIDDIRSSSNQKEIKKLSFGLNRNFKEKHRGIYITGDIIAYSMNAFIEDINQTENNKAVKYKDGILALYTSNQDQNLQINNIVDSIETETLSNIRIGVSQIHDHIFEMNQSINEAIMASSFVDILNQKILQYKELGIYRVLHLLKESDALTTFSVEILNKLLSYDKRNSTELLKTAEVYIENDGDLKKTAQYMFQHENTIRYRISKIKSILEMDNKNIEFYEQLSIAMKIKKMENIIVK